MFAFLKRFRRKKSVAKPVDSLRPVKLAIPPMPPIEAPRRAYQSPPVARSSIRHEARASVAYESAPDPIYFATPLYVPMDSPTIEVYTPPVVDSSPSIDCSPSYSAPDPSPSYDCSPSSIDYGSGSSDWS